MREAPAAVTHRPWLITRRPDTWSHRSRTNMYRLPPDPRLRHLPVEHSSKVVFGRQFQPTNDDHAPTRLKELVGLIDLERTNRAERMVVDLAVRERCGG